MNLEESEEVLDGGGGDESVSESVESVSDGDDGGWDGWDDWDGGVDNLPDHIRPHGTRIHERLSANFDAKEQDFRDIADVYNAVIREHEDPRVSKLTQERDQLQAEYAKYKTDTGPVGQQYKALQTEHKQYQQMVARDYADRFWARHADLKSNEGQRTRFAELLSEEGPHGGWDAEIAVELLDLPEDILAVAVAAKRDGVSDTYALKIAKSEQRERALTGQLQVGEKQTEKLQQERAAMEELIARKVASRPRPAARLTNGATTDTRPETRQKGVGDAGSLEEQRLLASRNALRVHRGGK